MPSELDNFTQKLLDRTRARNEALQQKMQEHSFQARKRRPLETQENIVGPTAGAASTGKVDQDFHDEIAATESPNKRSRVENENVAAASKVTAVKSTPSKSKPAVGERMQRLLNQRKQWEAAEHGDDVDFTNVPSPVHHEQQSPVAAMPTRRKVDIERKARLAALAQEFNSREDDLSHPTISSNELEPKKITEKPPTGTTTGGRKTPMSDVYRCETLAGNAQSTVQPKPKENVRPVKTVSQRVSLSIETLSQFANNEKPRTSRTPSKSVQSKLPVDRMAVGSFQTCSGDSAGHQVTPASKTLQERLIELQKHGCGAEQSALGSDKIVAEKNEEPKRIEENSDDTLEQKSDPSKRLVFAEEIKDDSINVSDILDAQTSMAVTTPERSEKDTTLSEDERSNLKKSETNTELDESGLSFGDSMMEELDKSQVAESSQFRVSTAVQCDLSKSFNTLDENISSLQESLHSLSESETTDQEDIAGDDQLIDDLFEGVTTINSDDDLIDPPFMSELENAGKPTLTRQKSRLEIKTELTVRKQTCNEAEDTHVLRRKPSRNLRPLARSNSSESIVSLGNENPNTEPLIPMFTIDSYRNEKRKSVRNVEKKIVRNEDVSSLKNRSIVRHRRVSSLKERNTVLLDEVQQQQRVIQQASAALNCCYDVHHGKGSITELEAEKLLLIASEKRLALLAEIQRLKSENKEEKKGIQPCFGSLTIENIQLPLRTEYIFSMASKKDGGENQTYYYFILVRSGAQKIVATHLASSHDDLSADALVFKDKFSFDDLESDFEISIEVYSVNHRSRASNVPNQDKSKRTISGIIQKNKDMKKKFGVALEKTRAKVKKVGSTTTCSLNRSRKSDQSLTPRKLKARSVHGSIPASPGGPNAIRISNFALIGSTTIQLEDVKKPKFVLQKVPFLSPISGHLGCKINVDYQSNSQQRGFLTMFDDVGGLGAWHRRWCALNNGVLYSWTYPDDEKHKEALSSLALRECISQDIHNVERIMCARPNTFELRTMRPRRQGDRDNLISQDTGSVITTRHWLAADTKEERSLWVEALNQALADVRAWNISALYPL